MNKPLKNDRYSGFSKTVNTLSRPDNLFEFQVLSYIFTAIFVIIDFCATYQIWRLVLNDSLFLKFVITAGCAIALDVPMIVAGIAVKKYQQGQMPKSQMLVITILSVSAFLLVFVFSLVFKIETRHLSLSINSNENMINSLDDGTTANPETEKSILIASVFNGFLPFATSIASFVLGYFGYDYKGTRLKSIRKARMKLKARQVDIKIILNEASDLEQHKKDLLEFENLRHKDFNETVDSISQLRSQAFGIALSETLGTPDEISTLTSTRNKFSTEYADFIKDHPDL